MTDKPGVPAPGVPPAPAPTPRNWLRLELPAVPENVALARVAVAAFASQLDFTLAELEEVRVAVSEAFSNAVLHAYPEAGAGQRPGPVTVEARIDETTLEVAVADRGRGIADVAKAREPAFTTRPDRMGLGFAFMDSFMDEVVVSTAPGVGTRVVMRKRAASSPRSGASSGVAGLGGQTG